MHSPSPSRTPSPILPLRFRQPAPSSLSPYKSAPAAPTLTYSYPTLSSPSDSDEEDYIRFTNGRFRDFTDDHSLPPSTPPRPSAIASAAAAYAITPSSPSSRGRPRTNSIASISGSPCRSNSGRRVATGAGRVHVWREASPEVWEEMVGVGGLRRRNSGANKFTTRVVGEERPVRYYQNSGLGSAGSSVSSVGGYLSSVYVGAEKKKDSKRVRFSLPM